MRRYLLLPILLLVACSASRVGEVGRAACTNGQDDDNDTRFDCADPDCQNLDICRKQVTPVDPKPDAGSGSGGSSSQPMPIPDAGQVMDEDSGMTDEDDGGLTPPMDAGPPVCTPACTATEECVDGMCKPVATDTPVRFTLTIRSALAANTNIASQCYEEGACIPFVCNNCVIDPYVQVMRVHTDFSADELGETEVDRNTTMPRFSGPAIEVELSTGEAVRFDVYDDNQTVGDRLLFSCKPDLRMLKSGPIRCVAPEGSLLRRLEVEADLVTQ